MRLTEKQFQELMGEKKKSKYGNVRVEVDGHSFDSKKEAERYGELKMLLKAGEISDLELQPQFVLQESFQDERVGVTAKGEPRTVRALRYTADFRYFDNRSQKVVVEDVKSESTKRNVSYRVRRALFLKQNPHVDFREV